MGTAERKGKSSSGKMKSFLAVTLLVAVASGDMMKKKIHHDMMIMNSQAMCWGKGNMMYYKLAMMKAMEECEGGHSSNIKPTNPFSQLTTANNPFQTLPSPVSNPFKSNSKPFARLNKPSVNANALNCVLAKLNMLDSNLQVNLKAYTDDFWNQIDLSQTLAGEDPVWRKMMNDGHNDCYDIARSFHQSALNKNPIMKVFGRHMVFFKCTKKVEAHCCGMAQANHMIETLYGSNDGGYDWSQNGLPNNKYERAAMYMKVQYGTATPEEKFVHNFFYMDPAM